MKLVDARLALEYKYYQMYSLVTDLECFLGSRSENLDEMDLRKAELIIQARPAVKDFNDNHNNGLEEYASVPESAKDICSKAVTTLLSERRKASLFRGSKWNAMRR